VSRPQWAAIDVGLFRDPKVAQLRPAEQVAYVASILWTVENLTDGDVPPHALTLIGVTRANAARFVALGLWDTTDNGWRLAAWDRWQKPRDEWETTLERRRHAAALGNCQRWHEEWCRCLVGDIPIPKNRSQKRSHLRSQV
jgi:hypothetical protein